MYDTRWPRPGPAMAVVAALVGLIAGAILGVSAPGSAPPAQASPPVESTVGPTTTTLPREFDTVILGSFNDRANAEDKLREVRDQGVDDAALLDREQYNVRTRWAIYSGVFSSQEQAEAHRRELADIGVTNSFWKHVTRTA
jgi:hypothetical protein